MTTLLFGLLVLVCPLMMMFVMGGMHGGGYGAPTSTPTSLVSRIAITAPPPASGSQTNLDHSRVWRAPFPVLALVIFTSVSDLVWGGGPVSGARAVAPVGAWFHGPGGGLRGRRLRGGVRWLGQGGASAKAAWKQVCSWWAQGQDSGILILRLRWPRTSRTAVCSRR
jgi:hypothetical protein